MPPERRGRSRQPVDTSGLFKGGANAGDSDLDYLLAGSAEETSTRARERGLPLRQLPVETIAPDPHQLRQLPHPDELRRREGYGDQTIAGLMEGLRALGRSLRESGQLQPVIVYADRDPEQPKMTHRLLHGQRRWTAAVLEGLPSVLAIEVPRPSEVERLQRQFDENERREDFTDMERAWAIVALREALSAERGAEAPWTEVEARLGLSDSRRRDLLRLLRLAPSGQELALRYRWAEWTLRPLHMAVSAGDIDPDTATGILVELARDGGEVTAPIVAAAVEEQRGRQGPLMESFGAAFGAPEAGPGAPSSPRQPDLVRQLQRSRKGMEQVSRQAQGKLDESTRAALMQEAAALMQSLEQLLHVLGGPFDPTRSTETEGG